VTHLGRPDSRALRIASTAAAALMLMLACEYPQAPNVASRSAATPASASTVANGETVSPQPCTAVAARWAIIDGAGAGEPTVRLPQPPGWEPVPSPTRGPISLMLRDIALGNATNAPAAVVALVDATAAHLTSNDLLLQSVQGLRDSGATGIAQTSRTVCGYPATAITYLIAPVAGSAAVSCNAVVAVAPMGDKVFSVLITVQSADPNNPTYQQDARVILSGLQILPPPTT
jgi:probable lipoprotein LpqN